MSSVAMRKDLASVNRRQRRRRRQREIGRRVLALRPRGVRAVVADVRSWIDRELLYP